MGLRLYILVGLRLLIERNEEVQGLIISLLDQVGLDYGSENVHRGREHRCASIDLQYGSEYQMKLEVINMKHLTLLCPLRPKVKEQLPKTASGFVVEPQQVDPPPA